MRKFLFVLCFLLPSFSVWAIKESLTHQDSIDAKNQIALTLIGKALLQQVSLCVAQAEENFLPSSRNHCEKLIDKKAIAMFNLYFDAFIKVTNKAIQEKIEESDEKMMTAFDYWSENSEDRLLKNEKKIQEIHAMLLKILNHNNISDDEWSFVKYFEKFPEIIRSYLEVILKCNNISPSCNLDLIKKGLKYFPPSAQALTWQEWFTSMSENQHVKNYLVGTGLGIFVWGSLVLKANLAGVVVPGGPEFVTWTGLPVVVVLTSFATASLAAYQEVDLWTLLTSNI